MGRVASVTADAHALRAAVDGLVVSPDDNDFDEARAVWNGMHDRYPAVIVRAAGPADVLRALHFARERDLPLAIRGGGHSVAGYGTVDGGMVIDLAPMQGVRVDPERRTVRVDGGVTLAVLDRETQRFDLAVPSGVISATGVGGLTLGGGVGWLTRPYGLTIDSLVLAEVVTADGRVVRASADEEAELFWGLRGGGGNFGIVTAFEFKGYPLGPEVFSGTFFYERPRWTDAIRAFARWTEDLPDDINPIATFITPRPSWNLGDRPLLLIGFVWAGRDNDAAARTVEQLRSAARPDIEVVEPTTWVAWQSAADEYFPKGVRAYWKNVSMDHLGDAAIDAIVEAASTLPSDRTGFDIHLMGGAVSRMAEDATAFPNRSARYWLNMYATWEAAADDDAARGWARRSYDALRPFAASGEYVNFLGASPGDPEAQEAARKSYGERKLARLRELKRRWDPDNIFRINHNIEPTV